MPDDKKNYKATVNGKLTPIENCVIVIPGTNQRHEIVLNNLPDISDSKQAIYGQEGIIGRSAPLYTYSNSGDRSLSMQLHFFITRESCRSVPSRDLLLGNNYCDQCGDCNLDHLRWIQSAVYPREGTGDAPYTPPPICRIKCGDLLGKNNGSVCVVLQSYSVRFPTEVAWDTKTSCPYRFDVDTSWLVVYSTEKLPYQNHIYTTGR